MIVMFLLKKKWFYKIRKNTFLNFMQRFSVNKETKTYLKKTKSIMRFFTAGMNAGIQNSANI